MRSVWSERSASGLQVLQLETEVHLSNQLTHQRYDAIKAYIGEEEDEKKTKKKKLTKNKTKQTKNESGQVTDATTTIILTMLLMIRSRCQ